MSDGLLVFDAERLKSFVIRVFEACGSPNAEAFVVADHLITANLMGYDSHGVIRIPQYLEDVQRGTSIPGSSVQIESETGTTAIVDCGWNFGPVGAFNAINVAISKAKQHHTSVVVTRRCGHAGRLGAYTQMAAEQGLFAFGVCNSPIHGHFVLPWGGRQGRLATNPMSFAVPCGRQYPILADFSTAESPEGKIRLFRNQGKPVPRGWIVDAKGEPTTNPADFYGPPRGAILPFGGEKGYRGFALSLMVEILGGLLAGSRTTVDQPGNGLGFLVVDIAAFQAPDHFAALIEELREYIKSSPPSESRDEVTLPGELDFKLGERRLREGIPIDDQTWNQIVKAAESVGVVWDCIQQSNS
jgi:uncharacterized oxidoreductase